jgi:hypothetical protein
LHLEQCVIRCTHASMYNKSRSPGLYAALGHCLFDMIMNYVEQHTHIPDSKHLQTLNFSRSFNPRCGNSDNPTLATPFPAYRGSASSSRHGRVPSASASLAIPYLAQRRRTSTAPTAKPPAPSPTLQHASQPSCPTRTNTSLQQIGAYPSPPGISFKTRSPAGIVATVVHRGIEGLVG